MHHAPALAPTAAEPRRAHAPGRAPLPAGPAALFAAAGTALGAAGHHLSTDEPPQGASLMLAATVLFAAALPAARRQRSGPFWVLWTLAGQGLLHLLLTWAAGPSGRQEHGAHAHAAGAGGHHGGSGMAAAHLLAALLVAVMVHRADRVWWTLPATLAGAARRMRPRLVPPRLAPVPVTVRQIRVPAALPGPLPTGRGLVGSVGRRGPPAGHALAA
ncbi:hypothetical protein ACFXKJ_25510 [Kitasatospora indigofera]|uniref:hypothetical protein n=1 Tax=Kitasatospora indigofera TaxID=67307 RepID=UPI0036AAC602